MCKICAEIHPQNQPKGRNFTHLEDPGILMFLFFHIVLHFSRKLTVLPLKKLAQKEINHLPSMDFQGRTASFRESPKIYMKQTLLIEPHIVFVAVLLQLAARY